MPPLALAGGREAEICGSTAPCSSSTPGTSERKTSSSAVERGGDRGGGVVGVDVDQRPRVVAPERADDGHEALVERGPDLAGAHAARLADEPELRHASGVDHAVGERQRCETGALERCAQLVA